jgi:uncharacterized protein YjbI with pentapeptide repeats
MTVAHGPSINLLEKTMTKTFCIAAAALFVSLPAVAGDAGFRFNAETGKCEDKAGVTGLNPGVAGECGDLGERANLTAASLRGSDLRRAYLFQADLRGADLRGTKLTKAHLSGAKLNGADLRGADLRGAYLHKADLSEADLRGAILTDGRGSAGLLAVNLSGAVVDEATELPFDHAEALKRGLVFVDSMNRDQAIASVQSKPELVVSR